MYYYSTTSRTGKADIVTAVLKGLADDGGLFMPSEIPTLPPTFIRSLSERSFPEIALEIATSFFSPAIPQDTLKNIIDDAINFDAPLQKIHDNIYTLELFHGPTLAFKDFGARVMARVMSYFLRQRSEKKLTILVATSGDTGSAVANGFLNVPNINVIILYPSGKVSQIQELQLTTMGNNITALEVAGTFDDCQRLVKTAFSDLELRKKMQLASANSINIARLIPQIFYYFQGYKQLEDKTLPLVVAIPSGNFGNLTAALMAKRMGLPISRLIAATNINDVVPKYLENGVFTPRPSHTTISNAMDVGNPSNFARMLCLCNDDLDTMRAEIWGTSVTDEETRSAISEVARNYAYITDPHGAVGYTALLRYLKLQKTDQIGIFLETAHPAKFSSIVEDVLKREIEIPNRLASFLKKEKHSIKVSADYAALKDLLLSTRQ